MNSQTHPFDNIPKDPFKFFMPFIFLKWVLRHSLPTLITICLVQPASAQDRDMEVYPYWNYYSHVTNVLYETLCETAFTQLEERESAIRELETREDWEQRQKEVKATLQEIVGEFPDKTPLNPVISGTIRQDGMVIEKLYFESRPGYYVTAVFCRPENVEGRIPAILFCSGHAAEGFRSETYQHMIFNYVKKGFAVLAFDPIGQGERIRYLDDDGKPRMGPTKEHSYPGSQSFLAGISPANYFIWDGIRAVDYLLTRKEVDPDRLGITGRSGGGTQTAYIAAMDDRIYAAAPECYITTFDKLLKSIGPQDAEQNLMYGIAKGIDMADYIEVRVPKPTLIVSTTRDIFSIQGVRDTYKEAKQTYSAFGVPDHLEKVEDDAGHASTVKNREATYAFFRKHFDFPGQSADEEVPIFEPEELWVMPSGNVYRDLGGEDIFSLTKQDLSNLRATAQGDTSESLRKKIIRISGYHPVSTPIESVFSGRSHYDGYAMEKYLLRGSGSYYLPIVWLKPEGGFKKTILFFEDGGKEAAGIKEGWVDQWLEEGYSVVLADLSGMGEIGGGYPGGDARIEGVPLNIWYAGILTGRNLVGIHAEEINRIRSFIDKEITGDTELSVVAKGVVGVDVLHAAFLQPGKEKFVLVRPIASYAALLEDQEYDPRYLMSALPGGIQYYDLPDLLRYFDPGNFLAINPVDGDNEVVNDIDSEWVEYASEEADIYKLVLKILQ